MDGSGSGNYGRAISTGRDGVLSVRSLGWTRSAFDCSRGFLASAPACLFGTSSLYWLAPSLGMTESFGVFGQDGYFELARSLVQGHGSVFEPGGSPVHHRPPLYPIVLTPILLFPDSLYFPALVLLHSVMIGCIGALVFKIARAFFGLDVARSAVILFLANPWLYANAKNPLRPVLQCLLYTTFIYLLGREAVPFLTGQTQPKRGGQPAPWLAIGCLGGLLSLTHGTLIAATGASIGMLVLLAVRRRNSELMRTALLAALVSVDDKRF